ncbi:brct domain-containing protein [Quercus suber]|uniref:Brct domain-containing protein n=1 Tax=Quercus suber TaxID=58331 RepID=A0AAW0JJY5_QUESU
MESNSPSSAFLGVRFVLFGFDPVNENKIIFDGAVRCKLVYGGGIDVCQYNQSCTHIMYRPLKDLNGIPGAKNLIICLTGYQRQDRDDVMTMVNLMGAQFSKPLVANKKFNPEKLTDPVPNPVRSAVRSKSHNPVRSTPATLCERRTQIHFDAVRRSPSTISTPFHHQQSPASPIHSTPFHHLADFSAVRPPHLTSKALDCLSV